MRTLKTAISIPEEIFLQAEETAGRLGLNQSQLFTSAVVEFLARHREDRITEQLNEVYADESSGLDPVLAAMQFSGLCRLGKL